MQVEGDAEGVGLLLGAHPLQNVQKPEDRVRVEAVRRGQQTDPEEGPVNDGIPVQNHQLHASFLLFVSGQLPDGASCCARYAAIR